MREKINLDSQTVDSVVNELNKHIGKNITMYYHYMDYNNNLFNMDHWCVKISHVQSIKTNDSHNDFILIFFEGENETMPIRYNGNFIFNYDNKIVLNVEFDTGAMAQYIFYIQ